MARTKYEAVGKIASAIATFPYHIHDDTKVNAIILATVIKDYIDDPGFQVSHNDDCITLVWREKRGDHEDCVTITMDRSRFSYTAHFNGKAFHDPSAKNMKFREKFSRGNWEAILSIVRPALKKFIGRRQIAKRHQKKPGTA